MNVPDPKANTTTEAYLAYKAGYLEESELKPVLYEPYLHFDAWLAYWAGLNDNYPLKGLGKNLFNFRQFYDNRDDFTVNDGAISITENSINYTGHTSTSSQWYPAHLADNKDIYGMTNLEPNTTYTISYKATTNTQCWVFFFNASNQRTQVQQTYTDTNVSMTFTTPSDLSWYAVRIDNRAAASNSITDIQIEQGSSASPYESYTGEPEMLTDEEALVAYLSGVTDTYPEEIKDPYDVRIVGYLRHLASIRWPEPDYPVNNEEFYLSTMDSTHTSNPVPSSDIELNTAEGKIISVEAYGDSFQQTYSGANLFDVSTFGMGGMTNGQITASSIRITNITMPLKVFPNTTYTISVNLGGDIIGFRVGVHQLDMNKSFISDSNWQQLVPNPYTFTTGPNTEFIGIVCSCSTTSTTVTTNSTESGYNASNPTQWLRGCTLNIIGDYVSPSPDTPERVQTVTGEQMVEVSGKNLWNPTPYKTGKTINASGVEIVTAGGSIWELKNVSANITFTISLKNNYVYTGNLRMHAYTSTGSWIEQVEAKSISANTSGSLTFTTPANTAFLRWGFWSDVSDAQLEIGSTATAYEPYQSQSYPISLGTIELCKIGDYQDYIYKSGDDWFVHKATGSILLTGDNITRVYYGCPQVPKNPSLVSFSLPKAGVNFYTNNFIPSPVSLETPSTTTGAYSGDSYLNFRYGPDAANLQEAQDWFNAHNTTLYAPLATPTDTQITDATLVGQLEALAGADTYNEKTYIKVTATEPNLPALLKVEAYKY